jgi:hypothetical protein
MLPTCLPPARIASLRDCEGLSSTGSTTLDQQTGHSTAQHWLAALKVQVLPPG